MPETYVVYGRMDCGYTVRALDELRRRNLNVRFIDVNQYGIEKFKKEIVLPGQRATVPQIFLKKTVRRTLEERIGGYTDLMQTFDA